MHKQVSVQLTSNSKFLSKFYRKPLSRNSDQKAPSPSKMKNFRFETTKVYSRIPPPPKNEKLQIWDDQSLLWNTPPWKTSDLRWPKFTLEYSPKWKTSDLRWPKFTPQYPPMKKFRFEMTKVYSGIPPPPPIGLESGRSYVETNLYPPWIPLVILFAHWKVFGSSELCIHVK